MNEMTRPFALSIVIPVYNGAASIGDLVGALSELAIPGGHEVVLVNDGSRDDSLEVCRRLVAQARIPVTLVNLSRNFGEHNAVMAGLAQARGDYIITMDDDLQNPPEEVTRLFLHARDGNYDVVYTYYAKREHAVWRNLGSNFTNWCADWLLDKPKGLYLSSFRCISAFARDHVIAYTGPYPYVDGLLLQTTQNIGTLEVKHLPRAAGRTNYTLRRLVRLFLSMFLNFSVMPLRIAAITGFDMSGIGALGLVAVLAEALLVGQTPSGWASLMAAFLLLAGVQLVILGLMGEYLGRLYLTANRKPQFIVREVSRASTDTAQAEPSNVARIGEPRP
jgi:undecaprenyl-phosphate 4-deoxy-4-formamido-L-arabinose transferase